MRAKWLAGVAIGVCIIYIAAFGIEGFGLSWLTGDLMKEDFTTDIGWTGTVDISNPIGQLRLVASGGRIEAEKTIALPSQFTIEMRLKIDSWGTAGPGEFFYQVSTSEYTHILSINQSRILLVGVGASPVSFFTDTNWHVWIITVDGVTQTQKTEVYVDSVKVATFTSMYPLLSNTRGVRLATYCSSGTQEAHVDYWYVDAGVKPPTSLPSDGTIVAHCTLDGSARSGVLVSVAGTTVSGTSLSDGSCTLTVPAGTYTVNALWSGTTIPKIVVVSSGVATDTDFAFQTNPVYGSITVSANSGGSAVVLIAFLSGPSPGSHLTPWTFPNLAFGTYTVSGTLNGEYKYETVTISATTPDKSVTLQYGGDGGFDILGILKAFVHQYRVFIGIVGGLTTTLSAVMVVLPLKRQNGNLPPQRYP